MSRSINRETQQHAQVFEAWYASNRNTSQTAENCTVKPRTLYGWIALYKWHERADVRDAEAEGIIARKAVARRAKLLDDQLKAGETLQSFAVAQLLELQKSYIKVKEDNKKQGRSDEPVILLSLPQIQGALNQGFELQKTALGMPAWAAHILAAPTETLLALERQIALNLENETTGTAFAESGEGGETAESAEDFGDAGNGETLADTPREFTEGDGKNASGVLHGESENRTAVLRGPILIPPTVTGYGEGPRP